MKVAEIRLLIGKVVEFESSVTHRSSLAPTTGVIERVYRCETEINGDYHENKSLKILSVIGEAGVDV